MGERDDVASGDGEAKLRSRFSIDFCGYHSKHRPGADGRCPNCDRPRFPGFPEAEAMARKLATAQNLPQEPDDVAPPVGYEGTLKTYDEVCADKRFFADRIAAIYDYFGLDHWKIGAADSPIERREPVIGLYRRQRQRGRIEGAVFVLGAIVGGIVLACTVLR